MSVRKMKNSEFIEFFLKIKEQSVAELTLKSYKSCLTRYLQSNNALEDLNPYEAQNIMFLMSDLSKATQRRNLTILKQYYNYAVKYRLTYDNPFLVVEPPKKTYSSVIDRVLNENELRVIIMIIDNLDFFWQTFFNLAIDTGARRGELVALRWDDIDIMNNTITIRHSAYCTNGCVKLKEPKGKKERHILITSKSRFLLYRFKALTKSKFVFCSTKNINSPINPSTATHYWQRLLKNNGLPSYRLHDLRHTCATYLLKYGIDINTVRGRLGHADLSTTQLYIHTNQDLATTNVLNSLLNGGVSC